MSRAQVDNTPPPPPEPEQPPGDALLSGIYALIENAKTEKPDTFAQAVEVVTGEPTPSETTDLLEIYESGEPIPEPAPAPVDYHELIVKITNILMGEPAPIIEKPPIIEAEIVPAPDKPKPKPRKKKKAKKPARVVAVE